MGRRPGEMTSDTLLLARSLSAAPGSLVVDLGCGRGGAALAAAAGNPGCRWLGVEIDPEALADAASAAGRARPPQDVAFVCCDVSRVPSALKGGIADAVLANPPYGVDGRSRPSPSGRRRLARTAGELSLYRFVAAGAHLLAPGGRLLLAGRPDMLPDMLLGMRASGLSPSLLRSFGPERGPAVRVVLEGSSGGASLAIAPREQVAPPAGAGG